MTDLKPCPFCGGEFPVIMHFNTTGTYIVRCNCCQTTFSLDCTAGHDRSKNLTIEAWNRRPTHE